ncbi:hypothetical protein [Salinibaculum rarum]|uniref:hypothetical protein n=1 Tax=Salinibaculum rarum TaxID=3058903 RepID=UPI00265DC369|nr:hypothetical protein [Salinibaculum sp. KK48]
MSKYERAYGTDWGTIDKDEAIDRAYALGVAASLGEYHPDELDRVREEMDTSYNKSVVDLAFDEGRNEARELDADAGEDAADPVWSELVEGETITVDEDDVPTGGRDGLPNAIDKMKALDRPEPGKNEAIDRPDFLEKD